MKVADNVRITEDKRLTKSELAKKRDFTNRGISKALRARIISLVDDTPGINRKELSRVLEREFKRGTINGALWRMRDKGYIKAIKQDQALRYYPVSYKLTSDKPKTETMKLYYCDICSRKFSSQAFLNLHHEQAHSFTLANPAPAEVIATEKPPVSMTQLAKDYFWEVDGVSTDQRAVKRFVEWAEKR
jgi:predicted transcriptional regulator